MKLAPLGDDIVGSDSLPVTLRCPLSHLRIALPARGVGCAHLQCFDLLTFLKVWSGSWFPDSLCFD